MGLFIFQGKRMVLGNIIKLNFVPPVSINNTALNILFPKIWKNIFFLELPKIYKIIHNLEPDSLECELKWALGMITMNKASGGDGIPAELFQILKDDAVKVLHSIYQQVWKTQQWPQGWKSEISFQGQRMLKLPHNCTHLTR